jgi:hypothetical protein
MINPATQLFMAQRMGARIRSEKVDHTPLVTAPERVIEMIIDHRCCGEPRSLIDLAHSAIRVTQPRRWHRMRRA